MCREFESLYPCNANKKRINTLRAFILFLLCAPGEIRTPDHLVRSQILYPAELRARMVLMFVSVSSSF